MLLFTWNLNENESSLRLALDHLGQVANSGTEFLATFQELPTIASSTEKARELAAKLGHGGVDCLGVVSGERAPGRLGLFSSMGISIKEPMSSGASNRMAMVTVRSASWSDLQVIAFHAADRRNAGAEYARGASAVLSRVEVEKYWKINHAMIIMGDFNADPYTPEVSARQGMFAVRDRLEAMRSWKSSLVGGPMRPLYNPMWHLLPESSERPGGTYLLNSQDQGIRWRLCDQILVSPNLISRLDGSPEIMSKLLKTTLVTRRGFPSRQYSDHLPVQLRVNL